MRRDGDELATAGLHFLHVRLDLDVCPVPRGHDDDGHVLVDQRDRAVLHLGGRKTLGVHIADLFQLQRAFHSYRKTVSAPEIEEVVVRDESPGHRLDLFRLLQHVRYLPRQRLEGLDPAPDLRRRHLPSLVSHAQREQSQRRDLRGERLRGRYADLGSAVQVDAGIGQARDRAAHGVDDAQGRAAAFLRHLEGGEGIGGLPRLGDPDHDRALFEHRVPVSPLRSVLDGRGQSAQLLEQVGSDYRGVPRSATGREHDALRIAQSRRDVPETAETDAGGPGHDPASQRLRDRFRLLVDFLQHEMGVSAAFRLLEIPFDLVDRLVDPGQGLHAHDVAARGVKHGHLAVIQVQHAPGVRENRRRVRRGVDRSTAQPDHQR